MKISQAFPSEYLKAADLNGQSVRVTIASVTMEKMGDDNKAVLHFVGKQKGLVLNVTNANRIVEAVGSDETEDWAGWSITLYSTKVDFQGRRVDAIRIDDRPGSSWGPKTAPFKDRRPAAPEPAFDAEDAPDEDVIADDIPF